jgi:hypothetical protein
VGFLFQPQGSKSPDAALQLHQQVIPLPQSPTNSVMLIVQLSRQAHGKSPSSKQSQKLVHTQSGLLKDVS